MRIHTKKNISNYGLEGRVAVCGGKAGWALSNKVQMFQLRADLKI